ncbi:Coronin-like protein [Zancudomyces culisetae]|uniref:Coronin n=1 Tax=Zancudomyces culisetae TaxID=1213189 RepID=A0A1R1PK70_ZANCU|nr:Coronin-like protein [Zancudomyces culisetae]|eukprot:OMH81371.1 Coronin-like protein [Zancudomyces culisetae]
MENIKPLAQLKGHGKRVGHVKFNPVAENVAASSGLDYSVRLWDIEHQGEKGAVGGFQDTIQSLDWNYNGTLVAASSRDKKLRLVDLRAKQVVGTAPSHQGGKGSRVVWLGSTGKLATTGFGRTSGRELFVWDVANLEKPELTIEIDTSSGILMPFYDESSKMLYLAGKGDGNIRYYEYEKSKMFYINEYTSTDPQRGMAAMPKRGVNVRDIELMRLFKAVNSNSIEPISFKAPRKDESFQADLYPPAPGGLAALSSEQYFSGSTADPVLVDFESIYTNGIAKLVPAEPTPVVSSETTPSSPPPSRASAPPPPLSPLASPHPESPVLSPTSAVESPHTISEPPSPTAGKSREIAEAPATANVYPPLEAVDTFLLDAKIEKVVSGYQELINQHSEALSKKIDSLTETQLALETKISELESSNTQLLSKISSYEQEIDSLKQLTDSLQTKSADLEDSFKAHDSRVSELESNLVTTIAAAAKLTSAVENFSP